MNSSGIKRGLAATAISALAVTGIPALAGSASAAPAAVTIASVQGFSAFDADELGTTADDFRVTVKEPNGSASVGATVQYRYTYTSTAPNAVPVVGPYTTATGTTDAKGEIAIPNPTPALPGTYKLDVRTAVGTAGTDFVNAAPITFTVGESEITLADGATARSTVNGTDTYAGKLALADGTPLANRTVDITYTRTGAGDAAFSAAQPAGTTSGTATTATAVTAADGSFSVSLTDPAATPGGVTESGVLNAVATALQGTGDAPTADAEDEVAVTFEATPVISDVKIDTSSVFGRVAPGKPVELDITVTRKDADTDPTNDEVLKDFPVQVSVDKGFLTPDTEGAGLTLDPNDLALEADQDDEGDLFGFYQDLGADETVDTSDDQAAPANAAGIVATIEKDAGFNDDGIVEQTVTVTAGGVTKTETITYDVRDYLNMTATVLRRDEGQPSGAVKAPGKVKFNFYAVDQFQNLIGDQGARISDDTPVAEVVTDGGFGSNYTETDFVNDNAGITATSDGAVDQTLTARISGVTETLVDKNGNLDDDTRSTSTTHTIKWVEGGTAGPKSTIVAQLQGKNNGPAKDKLNVVAPAKANGAVVKLFKVVGKKLVPAGTKTLKKGKASFTKADKNGRGFTKYVAKVAATSDTKADRSNTRNVR
jgi:hypothetical protein